jgi:3-mercaptopyruvate sulfurtransferase SseA
MPTMDFPRALVALCAALLLGWPVPGQTQEAVSAAQAREALTQGATAWDVRTPGALQRLPGAAQADLTVWGRSGGLAALAAAVSAAGIDLSRDVVLYGAAGDARAQALQAALKPVASGRVMWLVGGIDEWQAAGLPLVSEAAARLPVPQRLVALQPESGAAQPANAALRRSATASPLVTAGL